MASIGHNQPPVTNVTALSAADRKKLKDAVNELNSSMTRAAAERQLQNEIVNKVSEDIGVSKKLVKRLARVFFRANFNEEIEDNNQFEQFYVNVVSKSVSDDKQIEIFKDEG